MQVLKFDKIPNTNSFLMELSKKGAKSWTVVWTSEQTDGRGYVNNRWVGEPGQNLAVSVLIKSNLEYSQLVFFNQWICISAQRILSRLGNEVFVKWPNDLILDNKKIGGVLIQTRNTATGLDIITGIGLNINQKEFEGIPKAGSLFSLTGRKFDVEEILSALLTEMENSFELIANKQWEMISEIYHSRLYRRNEKCTFIKDSQQFEGTILGVNEKGELELKLTNGEIKQFIHKEIEMKEMKN